MNCSHKCSGSLQPVIDPLNAAAQCALDALQGVQLGLSKPQEAERATQLEEVERELQTPICKIAKLIAPAPPSPERFPCGPGVPLVPPPGAEVILNDAEGAMPGQAMDLAMTDFPILPGRRAFGQWAKEAAEAIDGFLRGRYIRPCCAITGAPVGEACQATDEVNSADEED